jgi:hypothetical protein
MRSVRPYIRALSRNRFSFAEISPGPKFLISVYQRPLAVKGPEIKRMPDGFSQ